MAGTATTGTMTVFEQINKKWIYRGSSAQRVTGTTTATQTNTSIADYCPPNSMAIGGNDFGFTYTNTGEKRVNVYSNIGYNTTLAWFQGYVSNNTVSVFHSFENVKGQTWNNWVDKSSAAGLTVNHNKFLVTSFIDESN